MSPGPNASLTQELPYASCPRAKTIFLTAFLSFSPSLLAATTTTTLAITQRGAPVTSIQTGTAVTLTATVVAGTTPVTPGKVNFCDATV